MRSSGGPRWSFGEVGVGVALRASWSTARLGVTLWMHCRGQGELKNTDGMEFAMAEVFTGGPRRLARARRGAGSGPLRERVLGRARRCGSGCGEVGRG